VSILARNSKVAAYQTVSVHGGVASEDPHKLVLMLMDGALDRLALARGFGDRGDIARKAQVLHSCITIITELRGSLNLEQGGPLAQSLNELYAYMLRQLMRAIADGGVAYVQEVSSLLGEIRGAWAAIGSQVAPRRGVGTVN
jgi:flagellar secretion chaperone FliS